MALYGLHGRIIGIENPSLSSRLWRDNFAVASEEGTISFTLHPSLFTLLSRRDFSFRIEFDFVQNNRKGFQPGFVQGQGNKIGTGIHCV